MRISAQSPTVTSGTVDPNGPAAPRGVIDPNGPAAPRDTVARSSPSDRTTLASPVSSSPARRIENLDLATAQLARPLRA